MPAGSFYWRFEPSGFLTFEDLLWACILFGYDVSFVCQLSTTKLTYSGFADVKSMSITRLQPNETSL